MQTEFWFLRIMYNAIRVKCISYLQETYSSTQAEGHWLAAHGRPHDQRLTSDLVAGRASAAHAGGSRECDGHWNAASVAVCGGDSGTCDALSIGGVRVRQLWAASIACLTVEESLGDVVVLQCDDGPVGQANELLDDSLDPDLQQRVDALGADLVRANTGGAHVGLVEHVGIVAQAEEVTRGDVLFECEEIGEFASAG